MEKDKRKEMIQEYRDRKPEMGIIAIRCNKTDDIFYGMSTDTRADYNGNRFKLNLNSHPNKQLQKLWNEHGEDSFDISLAEELEYDDPHADYKDDLIEMLQSLLESTPGSSMIIKRAFR